MDDIEYYTRQYTALGWRNYHIRNDSKQEEEFLDGVMKRKNLFAGFLVAPVDLLVGWDGPVAAQSRRFESYDEFFKYVEESNKKIAVYMSQKTYLHDGGTCLVVRYAEKDK